MKVPCNKLCPDCIKKIVHVIHGLDNGLTDLEAITKKNLDSDIFKAVMKDFNEQIAVTRFLMRMVTESKKEQNGMFTIKDKGNKK